MKEFYAGLGAFVAGLVTMVASTLIGGWVLTILWGWFIVPVFQLPRLGLVPAIGLGLVVRKMTYQVVDVEPPDRTAGEKAFRAVLLTLAPLFYLGFGWIVHQFM